MCRLLAWASTEPANARQILDANEWDALRGLARFHADGWGMAASGGAEVRRSTRAASDDAAFDEAAGAIAGTAALVHLRRATPGYAVVAENTHPFVLDGWAFAHNGTIAHAERLDGLVSVRWRERRRGTTDSERYFLAFLQRLEEHGDPAAAIRATVAAIRAACGANGLNAVLCSADQLMAVHAAGGQNPDRAALVTLMGPEVADPANGVSPDHLADYFGLRYRTGDGHFVISSTGIAGADWKPLAEESLVLVDLARAVVECRGLGDGELRWSRALQPVERQSTG